jgi:predicted metallopeptidase
MGLLRVLQLSLFGNPEKELPRRPPAPIVAPEASLRPFRRRTPQPTLNELFASLMQELCGAISEFESFDLSRVKVSVGTSRSRSKHGVWAYVTPLRYVGGGLYRKGLRRGVPGVYTYKLGSEDLEAQTAPLYLVTILVPRFFFLSFEERIETIVHELYHMHPEFRGDLRRFAKPHIHHGPTPAAYNRRVRELVTEALQRKPELREHHLLKGAHADFETRKKLRVTRPTLRFVPKMFSMVLLAASLCAPRVHADDDAQRTWRWPWEDRYAGKSPPAQGALADEFNNFDEQTRTGDNPRFLVSPTEVLSLKSSPSEWSVDLLEVKPGQTFLAFTVDSTGDWIFLRSRKVQGWVPAEKLSVVGQLARPEIAGDFAEGRAKGSSPNVSSTTLLDGDPIFVPSEGDIGEDDLLNFNKDLDTVIATNGGPLHEQPDPLSVRYASVQPGDKVLILKRGEKGDWAYIRLLLTGEEGWFPSEWLRITRGSRVSGAGRGLVTIDLDGAYGTSGRNYGFGLGTYFNLMNDSSPSRASSRFEVGAFFQSFAGEELSFSSSQSGDTYRLVSGYSIFGAGARWVGFSDAGFVGGALEAAGTYQLTSASLAGLSEEIISETGIRDAVRPRIGLLIGARGIMSLTSWMQLNALFRINLASQSNLFWGGAGLSFRIF